MGISRTNKVSFLKQYIRNNGATCPIFLQFSVFDDKYLENFIEKVPDTDYDQSQDFENDIDEIFDSERSETLQKLQKTKPEAPTQYESLSAI